MINIEERDNVEKLEWLLSGKALMHESGSLYTISGIEVIDAMETTLIIDGDMVMDDFQVHVDARDEQINELKDIIARQMEEIQKLVKKSQEPEPRKSYRRLTTAEEKEIVEFIRNNPKDTYASIGKRFEISGSSAHRIAEEYKIRKVVKRSDKNGKSTK